MSINASLQQISGGFAAVVAGLVVVQKDKFSPLEHYDILGFMVVGITLIGLFLVYRVTSMVRNRNTESIIATEESLVMSEGI